MLAAACAIAFGGWLVGRSSTNASDRALDAEPAAADAAQRDDAALAEPRVRRPPRAAPDRPLPPIDTPLRDVIADLQQRANAGEAAASCRLAAEMEYCDNMRTRLAGNATLLRRANAMGDMAENAGSPPRMAGMRAAQQAIIAQSEKLLADSEHCAGAPEFSADQRVHHWRAAAFAGNVAAQRHYAVGNAFRLNDSLDNLDELRTYRGEAEDMAWRAVKAGDLPATLALAHAYSPAQQTPRRYLLAQSVRPDAARALSLFLLVQARTQSNRDMPAQARAPLTFAIQELEEDLAPEIRAQARRDAEAYARDIPAGESDDRSVARAFFGGTPYVSREQCDGSPPAAPAGADAGS